MTGYILSFFVGVISTLLIQKIKIKKDVTPIVQKEFKNPKINCINCLLNEIREKGQLLIKLSAPVMMSLREISKTEDWFEKLDNETIENLYNIYQKWQKHIKGDSQEIVKASKIGGFQRRKFWEGTQKQYIKACRDGIIDENTDVRIIEYTGSIISMDENGQIEEYMD